MKTECKEKQKKYIRIALKNHPDSWKERFVDAYEKDKSTNNLGKLLKDKYGLSGSYHHSKSGYVGYDAMVKHSRGIYIIWDDGDEDNEKEAMITWNSFAKELIAMIQEGKYQETYDEDETEVGCTDDEETDQEEEKSNFTDVYDGMFTVEVDEKGRPYLKISA